MIIDWFTEQQPWEVFGFGLEPEFVMIRVVTLIDWDWPAVPECAKPVCPMCLSPI